MTYLGSGMYSSVYEEEKEGTKCAVKYVTTAASFNKEVKVLEHIRKNGGIYGVVNIINHEKKGRRITMELVRESISLEEYVKMDVLTCLDRDIFMKTLLTSVVGLIDIGVDHGDFKAKNILVSVVENNSYLHDFGLSTLNKYVSIDAYKYRLFIIFLQIFLEVKESVKLLIKGFTEKTLYDNWEEGLKFTEETAFQSPLGFTTIYNLTKRMSMTDFRNAIHSDFAHKFLDVYEHSSNIEDYRRLLE
jgi:serine/threonine protein kinase